MLELQGVSGGYGTTTIVRDVSLRVEASSVVALLGPNGAGKTTLFRLISGLLKASSGTVTMDGDDLAGQSTDARARRGLCLVPEGHGVFPSLTVRENIALHTPGRDRAGALERALDAFPSLRRRIEQRAGTLSGGEQQMLALSRAYICNPRVVLVDEASLGLAPVLIDEVFAFLRQLAAEGTALLIVEQFVGRVLELADRAYILSRGRIAYDGPSTGLDADQLMEQYFGVAVG